MIVCKYSVAWGTTVNRAKIREAPAPASRRALTCAQANRGVFARPAPSGVWMRKTKEFIHDESHIAYSTEEADVLDQL